MFTSTHYAGKDLNTAYRNGEPWKKVLGPVFVYLNSISPKENSSMLWEDAKEQVINLLTQLLILLRQITDHTFLLTVT
jgi:hypothetical protein